MRRKAVFVGIPVFIAVLIVAGVAGVVRRSGPAIVSEGKDVVVPRGRTVNGDIMVISADASIAGRVNGSAIVRDGRLLLYPTARITGDAVAIGGRLRVRPGARVMGRTVSIARPIFGPPPPGPPGFGGASRHDRGRPMRGWGIPQAPRGRRVSPHLGARGFGPPFAFGGFGIGLLVGPLLAGAALGVAALLAERKRAFVERTGEAITRRTVTAALAGSGVLAILFVIVHVGRAFVGFPLALALGFCVGVLMLAAAMIPAPLLGGLVGRLLKKGYRPAVETVIGGLLIVLVVLIPFIGPLVLIAASALGLGALVLSVRPSSRPEISKEEEPVA